MTSTYGSLLRQAVTGATAALVIATSLGSASAQSQRQSQCPRDAVVASQSVWAAGSIRLGQVRRGKHACGRTIECSGGTLGQEGSRACRWL